MASHADFSRARTHPSSGETCCVGAVSGRAANGPLPGADGPTTRRAGGSTATCVRGCPEDLRRAEEIVNMHTTELPSSAPVQWEWKRPSNWIFVLSIVRDIAALLRTRPILVTSIITVILVTLYAYRYAWEPYVLFVPSIYIGGIIGVVGITLLMWYGSGTLIGWVFPKFKPLAAIFKPAGGAFGPRLIFSA